MGWTKTIQKQHDEKLYMKFNGTHDNKLSFNKNMTDLHFLMLKAAQDADKQGISKFMFEAAYPTTINPERWLLSYRSMVSRNKNLILNQGKKYGMRIPAYNITIKPYYAFQHVHNEQVLWILKFLIIIPQDIETAINPTNLFLRNLELRLEDRQQIIKAALAKEFHLIDEIIEKKRDETFDIKEVETQIHEEVPEEVNTYRIATEIITEKIKPEEETPNVFDAVFSNKPVEPLPEPKVKEVDIDNLDLDLDKLGF